MSPGRPFARALAVLAALVAAAGVALHHSTSEIPAVLVLATFALWAWAFCLVALLAALRARSVVLTVVAVVLVGAGAAQYGPLVVPAGGDDRDDDEGVALRILAQNLEFGRADPDDVVHAVRERGVDVAEADRLREYLGGLPGPAPVVVGGDFNATWDHVRFRGLREIGYTDSVSGGGDGWVPTWPADRGFPPLIGIDHVLARGAVHVGETSTVQVAGSDHLGVLATVWVPGTRTG